MLNLNIQYLHLCLVWCGCAGGVLEYMYTLMYTLCEGAG